MANFCRIATNSASFSSVSLVYSGEPIGGGALLGGAGGGGGGT